VAARLGATYFLAVGNDPDEARMTANLARLAEAAGSHRLSLALELMPYTAVNSLAKAHRMVASCRAPNLGLLIDALHLARAGGTPAEVAALPREHIAYLQLCDAPAQLPPGLTLRQESLSARLYPGDGALPLISLMNSLPEGIVIDVETPVVADRGLSPAERARNALSATQHFLTAWQAAKTGVNN
jgi:sugar phosphate isomerase/epimerase